MFHHNSNHIIPPWEKCSQHCQLATNSDDKSKAHLSDSVPISPTSNQSQCKCKRDGVYLLAVHERVTIYGIRCRVPNMSAQGRPGGVVASRNNDDNERPTPPRHFETTECQKDRCVLCVA